MTLHGIIQNGVVILDGATTLPEGTPVTVQVEDQQVTKVPGQAQRMTDEEHRRLMEIMDRIAALPNENPDVTFSGADHDQALYGPPQ